MMASASFSSSSSADGQPMRVVLRVRPFLPSEEAASGGTPCVALFEGDYPGSEVAIELKDRNSSRCEHYFLDSFFGQRNSINDIFNREVSALIPGVFEGTNATVFAYGASGSGKTYTMQGTADCPGLIPLAVSSVLTQCTGMWCSVEISYYEVYMERCYDLLKPKATELMVLDDKDGNVNMKGMRWVPVHSMEEFEEVYSIGVRRRKVAHTGLNDASSRSHAVLSLRVSAASSVKGKLNLIDLAGSEDNRRTMNEGIRFQESSKINQSLFALSNVISAIKKNELRIPYRANKLTRILQDSLGGGSCALMVACLNPAEYQEAINTLSVAAHSSHVVGHKSSAYKAEKPSSKAEKEAKLQAWWESNRKMKSVQRMKGPFSPSASKTPSTAMPMDKGGIRFKKLVKSTDCVQNENLSKACAHEDRNVNNKVVPPPVRALSPISDTSNSPSLLEPQTPEVIVENENIPALKPLDKLYAVVKETFIQQYLELLNCSNKEELQQLKGIGPRRAEYILEVRKDSPRPFKSIADLENIGLSEKQIQDILKKTVSEIFK